MEPEGSLSSSQEPSSGSYPEPDESRTFAIRDNITSHKHNCTEYLHRMEIGKLQKFILDYRPHRRREMDRPRKHVGL
jgi:hypothetical protein